MKDKHCSVQLRAGNHCQHPQIVGDRCHWHSDTRKNDASANAFFPQFPTLKVLIETEKPNLERASFNGATLSGFDFSDLYLDEAYFVGAVVTDCLFKRASLRGVNFTDTNLDRSDLSEACLDRAGFVRASLRDSHLSGARLVRTSFDECDLTGADLRSVSFQSTKLSFSNLYRADLTGAKFSNRRMQLRLCNVEAPDPIAFFEHEAVRRVTVPAERKDVLSLLQYLSRRLPEEHFGALLRKLFSALAAHVQVASERNDQAELADVLGFLGHQFKITHTVPSGVKMLPPSPSAGSDENLITFRAIFRDDRIAAGEFLKLNSTFFSALRQTTALLMDRDYAAETEPLIVFLSLQSPFEMIASLAVAAAAIIKLWSKWLDARQKEVDVDRLRFELDRDRSKERRLDRALALFTEHIGAVHGSENVIEYSLSCGGEKLAVKVQSTLNRGSESVSIGAKDPVGLPGSDDSSGT